MGSGVVGKNQNVLSGLMPEEVVDAFFFHKAADEIEVGLAVLDAVVAGGEIAVEAQFEIVESEIFENLLDNVGNLLVLEDFAIGRARQKPGPGNHLGSIGGEAAVLRTLGEAADEAVPVPLGTIRVKDSERDIFANDVFEFQGIVFGQEVEIEVKELGDGF